MCLKYQPQTKKTSTVSVQCIRTFKAHKNKMCSVTSAMTTWSVSHTHTHKLTNADVSATRQTLNHLQLIAIKKKTDENKTTATATHYTKSCTVEHWISARWLCLVCDLVLFLCRSLYISFSLDSYWNRVLNDANIIFLYDSESKQ